MSDDWDQPEPKRPAASPYSDDRGTTSYGEQHDWFAPEDDSRVRTFLFKFLPIFFLCLIGFWAAWQGSFLWQDDNHVTANLPLRTTVGLQSIWNNPRVLPSWQPLGYSALWPQYRIWEDKTPLGYHLVSLGLHTFSALFVWMLLRRLELSGAFVAAVVFALHPLQVEAPAWIARQPMMWSAFFGLAFAVVYLRFSGADATIVDPSRVWRLPESPALLYPFAVLLYVLAVLSSPLLVCTLPLVMLVIVWWKKEDGLRRADVLWALPLVLIGLGGAATHWIVETQKGFDGSKLTVGQWLILMPEAVGFYARKFFWPSHLSAIYPKWDLKLGDLTFVLSVLALILSGVAFFVRRRQIGRAAMAGWLMYLLLLLPFVSPLNRAALQTAYVADRFHYLALAVLAGAVIHLAASSLASLGMRFRPLRIGLATVLITALLIVVSAVQAPRYASAVALFENAAGIDNDNIPALMGLGKHYEQNKDVAKAMDQYQQVLRLTQNQDVDALLAMGRIFENRKPPDVRQAMRYYSEAYNADKTRVEPYREIARVFIALRRFDEAMTMLQESIGKLGPNDSETLRLLGFAQASKGQQAEALATFRRAVEINPQNVQARVNLAEMIFAVERDVKASMEQLVQAVQIDPRNPESFYLAGRTAWEMRDPVWAYRYFRVAGSLRDNFADAWFMAGVVQAQVSMLNWQNSQMTLAAQYVNDAVGCLQRAVSIEPNNERYKRMLEEVEKMRQQQNDGRPAPRPATTQSTQRATP